MDVKNALRCRKSIRGFRPDSVPGGLLHDILESALRAPSSDNSQPWEVTVVAGEVLESIRKSNIELLRSGAPPRPDIRHGALEGEYRKRQIEVAIRLFGLLGISREDKEARARWLEKLYRFFDAPAVIFLAMDKRFDSEPMMLLGIGGLELSICLAAWEHGLGTCIGAAGVNYPDMVRKHLGMVDSKRILTTIAIGYPDWDYPANKLETPREPVDEVVRWIGCG